MSKLPNYALYHMHTHIHAHTCTPICRCLYSVRVLDSRQRSTREGVSTPGTKDSPSSSTTSSLGQKASPHWQKISRLEVRTQCHVYCMCVLIKGEVRSTGSSCELCHGKWSRFDVYSISRHISACT